MPWKKSKNATTKCVFSEGWNNQFDVQPNMGIEDYKKYRKDWVHDNEHHDTTRHLHSLCNLTHGQKFKM